MECIKKQSYFSLMRMLSNFPLGQLSSPTTSIFPGQAPAIAPSVCVYVLYVHANICFECLYIV